MYDPPLSYWCAEVPQGGGHAQFTLPAGLSFTSEQLPHAPYANVSGGVLWAWRPGHWANWAFEMDVRELTLYHALAHLPPCPGGAKHLLRVHRVCTADLRSAQR